jgi:hypothetical protein
MTGLAWVVLALTGGSVGACVALARIGFNPLAPRRVVAVPSPEELARATDTPRPPSPAVSPPVELGPCCASDPEAVRVLATVREMLSKGIIGGKGATQILNACDIAPVLARLPAMTSNTGAFFGALGSEAEHQVAEVLRLMSRSDIAVQHPGACAVYRERNP